MSQTAQAEIGLIGLGVMGQNLALNIAEHGHRVAVYNRTSSRTEDFAASDEAKGFPVTPCLTLEALVGGAAAAARDHPDGQGGRGDRPADRGARRAARAGRSDRRRRQCALYRHDPARSGPARARPAVLRHRHLGRRGGRSPRPFDHGRRRGGSLCPRRAGLRGDRRQGRRRSRAAPTSAPMAPATSSRCCTTASNMPTCS